MNKKIQTVAIVTSNLSSTGSVILERAASRSGFTPVMCLAGNDDTARIVDSCDAVIYRRSPKTVAVYERLYTQITNESHKLSLKHSLEAFGKCDSYEKLVAASVSMPVSSVVTELTEPPFLPGVLKPNVGNKGTGVILIGTSEQYRTSVMQYINDDEKCLYQEYIEESKGTDKRIIVCDQKVVTAMRRVAKPGEFRANIHLGASAEAYEPSAEERLLAIKAVQALGLPYGGVDMIDSKKGPLVLEVNPSPGFSISKVTGVDIAEAIIKCVGNEGKSKQ